MANLITLGRLALLFLAVALIYFGNVAVITGTMFLVIFIFASDGIDGYVARRRGSSSQFGAVFDIVGDRIVENVFWIVFADLGLIPIWIPLMVLTRGFIVDGLRSLSLAQGMTAFGEKNMMRSAVTRWLTAGRFMRGLYGYAKAGGFVYLTGLTAYKHHVTQGTWLGAVYDQAAFRAFGWAMVWLAVVLTVVRAVPVLYDTWGYARAAAPVSSVPPTPVATEVAQIGKTHR